MFFTKDMRLWGVLFLIFAFYPFSICPIFEDDRIREILFQKYYAKEIFCLGYLFFIVNSKKFYFSFMEKEFPKFTKYLYAIGWVPYVIYALLSLVTVLILSTDYEEYKCHGAEIWNGTVAKSIFYFCREDYYILLLLSLLYQFIRKPTYVSGPLGIFSLSIHSLIMLFILIDPLFNFIYMT